MRAVLQRAEERQLSLENPEGTDGAEAKEAAGFNLAGGKENMNPTIRSLACFWFKTPI